VDQRAKRRKTDRLDGEGMLDLLIRHHSGNRSPLRVVNVPQPEIEDARRLHRERQRLVRDRTRHTNRLKDMLIKFGIRSSLRDLPKHLGDLRGPDGSAIAQHAQAVILREYTRFKLVKEQIGEIETDSIAAINSSPEACRKVGTLSSLRGIGLYSAQVLYYEFFWRKFNNRREVGALAGMVSVPWLSDKIDREQGISKAGNHRVRTLMVQLAWSWLRFQPQSRLAQWFNERYGPHSRRSRKVGIVAVARKLLIQLWRFVETRVPPELAQLSA
jgi:transposase